MDKTLLDTDLFSEILRGVNQNVVARATSYHSTCGYYTISVITVLEIVVKGFHKLKREDKVQQFLAGVPAVELLTWISEVRNWQGESMQIWNEWGNRSVALTP